LWSIEKRAVFLIEKIERTVIEPISAITFGSMYSRPCAPSSPRSIDLSGR